MKVYKHWRNEVGTPSSVDSVEFIDYVRKGPNDTIEKFEVDGTTYIGEIWLFEDEAGQQIEGKIRVEYDPDLFEDKTQEVIPAHLVDNWANPIVDPKGYYREFINTDGYVRRKRYPNKELLAKKKQDTTLINLYKKTLKLIKKKDNKDFYNYIKLKISHKISPDYRKFRQLQRLQSVYQNNLNELIQNI